MLPLTPIEFLKSTQCSPPHPKIRRYGVMLHFDDSSQDEWAVKWFKDPACHVSYNRLYLDNGDVVQITPTMEHVAWHAGQCTLRFPNTQFYGLAAATNTKVPVTEKQLASIVQDCAALFEINGWRAATVDERIIGHEDVACFANGKLGRKIDPTGLHRNTPILSTADVRRRVKALL